MNTRLCSVLNLSGSRALAWDEGTAARVEAEVASHPLSSGTGHSEQPLPAAPTVPLGTSMTASVSALSSEECMWETDFAQ